MNVTLTMSKIGADFAGNAVVALDKTGVALLRSLGWTPPTADKDL